MQAIREITDRNGLKNIIIPDNYGDKFEIIILPIVSKENQLNEDISDGIILQNTSSYERMKLQQETGFAKHIIGSEKEDIWNDLI